MFPVNWSRYLCLFPGIFFLCRFSATSCQGSTCQFQVNSASFVCIKFLSMLPWRLISITLIRQLAHKLWFISAVLSTDSSLKLEWSFIIHCIVQCLDVYEQGYDIKLHSQAFIVFDVAHLVMSWWWYLLIEAWQGIEWTGWKATWVNFHH